MEGMNMDLLVNQKFISFYQGNEIQKNCLEKMNTANIVDFANGKLALDECINSRIKLFNQISGEINP